MLLKLLLPDQRLDSDEILIKSIENIGVRWSSTLYNLR